MKMTRVIDAPEAIELLERAVEEKGADYVDPNAQSGNGCAYATTDGYPACIVGHVFSYLGVDPSKVEAGAVNTVVDSDGITNHYGNTIPNSPVFSDDARWVLGRAQVIQDNKGTWGAALIAAKKAAEVSA